MSQACSFIQKKWEQTQRLVKDAQTGDTRTVIRSAATEYKQHLLNQSSKLWMDHYPEVQSVTEMAASAAAYWSAKYNHMVKNLTLMGRNISSFGSDRWDVQKPLSRTRHRRKEMQLCLSSIYSFRLKSSLVWISFATSKFNLYGISYFSMGFVGEDEEVWMVITRESRDSKLFLHDKYQHMVHWLHLIPFGLWSIATL